MKEYINQIKKDKEGYNRLINYIKRMSVSQDLKDGILDDISWRKPE